MIKVGVSVMNRIKRMWSQLTGTLQSLPGKLVWASALAIVLGGGFSTVITSAAPPLGFQTSLIAGSGLEGPSGFEIAPDGRIFVLERTGAVKIIKNGQVLPQPFVKFDSVASGDRGLIGVAFDPDFGRSNNWVYFYYTGQDLLNHLVRYDASGDVGTNGPLTLFQTQSPSQQLHVGGSIQFGPDGKMYFAVGDNGYPPNGQDLSNPHGKILRVNKDGTIPTDNPFYGQPDKLGAIWAYGLRNPWRFQFDSQTGKMYGADVGDYTWEEMNHIVKGGNYGWPLKEGNCVSDCAGFINPIHTYNHNGESAAAVGGPVYRGQMFPAEFQGNLFFADYAQGFIKRMTLDAEGNATGIHDFDTNAGSVVDMKVAPDGSMYYITYYPGRMYRISHDSANPAPTANATADKTKGAAAPFTVNFSSTGSSDPNGDQLTYLWNFGDGTTSTAANPTKTFTTKGAFTVELTVSDGTNTSQATPIVVQVGTPPTVTIAAPAANSTYVAGQTITYNAFANDAAGFDLNDADIKTDIVFHHDTHTHPFIDDMVGRAGSFTIPDTGEAAPNTWYRIHVTATDASGVSDTKSIDIYPRTAQMTYTASVPGLQINLDGVPHAAPHAVQQVVNFRREVSAPAVQTGPDGQIYQFKGWSDGGAVRHFVAAPEGGMTLTAIYEPAGTFKGEYFDNANLQGAPKLVRNDPKIDFAWGFGAPADGLPEGNFSVRWSKQQYFAAGRYKFTVLADDGVRLFIDGKPVIDKWQDQNAIWTYTADLTAGNHDIRMEYYDAYWDAVAKLTWEATPDQGTPAPVGGWRGEYYANTNLQGSPVLLRGDEKIDFDWGQTAPGAGVPENGWSASWTKTQTFEAGTYRFTATADDGVRVYLNDELIIDQWKDQAATTYTVDKILTAGPKDLKVEYFDSYWDAVAKFDVEKLAVPPAAQYQGEYFDNKNLTGQPVLTRTDAAIDFDWGQGAPAAGLPVGDFSVRWTKTDTFAAGMYKFTATTDDGVRLYVDGKLVIDQWNDHGPTPFSADVPLTEGSHQIVMEYYDAYWDAIAKMNYVRTGNLPTQPAEEQWHIYYYAGTDLQGTALAHEHANAINFDWGQAAPAAGVPAEGFSGTFTKLETFQAGTYQFDVAADDGVRLYVDGKIVLDQWKDQAAQVTSVLVPMTAGQHTVKLEYYDRYWDAVLKLNYALATDTGYKGEYFGNKDLAGQPLLTRDDAAIDFNWGHAAPAAGLPEGNFSARWTKDVQLTPGTYRFTATADDGVRVYLDDQLIIDQWNDHAATTFTADRTIVTTGTHRIRVEYYDSYWDAIVKFSYTKLETV